MSEFLLYRQPLWRTWRIVLLITGMLSAGCATPPVEPLAGEPWESRRVALTALQDWTLSGRISVIREAEGWHASVRWIQTEQGYSIDLKNPLGQVVARIQGGKQGVRVQTSDGQLFNAADPDTLVEQTLGMRIPISGLRYWVRGVPDPAVTSVLEGDRQGRLTRLEQDGWVIEYPRYTQTAGLELPARVRARQEALKVQLVVKQWDVPL